jgi:hypothetical protein
LLSESEAERDDRNEMMVAAGAGSDQRTNEVYPAIAIHIIDRRSSAFNLAFDLQKIHLKKTYTAVYENLAESTVVVPPFIIKIVVERDCGQRK